MMVSGLVTSLRRKYGDLPTLHLDSRLGDGSSTVYKTQFAPIYEPYYNLYINNVLKQPGGVDYTIDLDTGDVVLAAATSQQIDIKYKSATFRDAWWLETVQGAIRAMGDEFFRGVVRASAAITLSAGVQVYPCPTGCIRLTEVLQSDSNTVSGNYRAMNINHWYDRRSNSLVLGAKPSLSNFTQVSYLRRIAIPSALSMTLDLEENWIEMLDLKCGSTYMRARAIQLAQRGNVAVESGHLSIQGLRQMANDNEDLYQRMKRRNRPLMPSYAIPYYNPGAGDVQTP